MKSKSNGSRKCGCNTCRGNSGNHKPSYAVFWTSIAACISVLLVAAIGHIFQMGPYWTLVRNGVTVLAAVLVWWAVRVQRRRNAILAAKRIDEVLVIFSNKGRGLSDADLKLIETQLQQMRSEVLRRANIVR